MPLPNVPGNVRTAPLVSFNPPTYGFPDKLMTHLRYHDTVILSSVAGAPVGYLFRLNSTFDPDYTGVGHQPLYRDTFASLYNHYVVTRAWGTIKCLNPSASPWIVGYNFDDDTSISGTINTLAEQNHSKKSILTPLTGSRSMVDFRFEWSYKDFLGIDPITSQAAKTSVGSNPDDVAILTIFGQDLVVGTTSLEIEVELYQEVFWTELTTPTQS